MRNVFLNPFLITPSSESAIALFWERAMVEQIRTKKLSAEYFIVMLMVTGPNGVVGKKEKLRILLRYNYIIRRPLLMRRVN